MSIKKLVSHQEAIDSEQEAVEAEGAVPETPEAEDGATGVAHASMHR